MVERLTSDLRLAVRGLLKRPGFAVAALLTLGLGIGANATVFSMVNALLLRPLPLGDHGDRVVALHSTHATQPEDWDWDDSNLSPADLQDLRASARSLEDVAGYVGLGFTLMAGGEAVRISGGSISPNLFSLLGMKPVLGRDFREEEGQDFGFASVALVSHRFWERRLGSDPAVVGRNVILNDRPLTIVGVMPPGVRFPERDELWVPYRPSSKPERAPRRSQRFVTGFGLLAPGVSVSEAQGELDLVAARLADQHPDTNRGWGIRAMSFRDSAVDRGMRIVAVTLLGAVAAVLLIGCANLASLILARGVARQRELAVRSALGASRGRLVGQVLAEVGLLCGCGAVLGLLVGVWCTDLMVASWPEELPYWVQLDLDWRSVAFTTGIAILAALFSGLLPALRSSRPDLLSELRDGSRSSAGLGHQRLQSALVVGQVALSVALLAGASLMIRSFFRLQQAPSGFVEEGLLTLRFYIAGDAYDEPVRRAELLRTLEERLAATPGIARAAATSSIPTDDGGATVRLAIEGQPIAPGEEPAATWITASPSLFETLGAPLLEGRTFTPSEHAAPESDVAIVNQSLARRFFPKGALGGRLALVDAGGLTGRATVRWLRVVGVAPDLQYEEFGEETAQSRLNVFLPYAASPGRSLALLVRTKTTPRAQADAVRRVFREIDPGLATWDVRSMEEVRVVTTWEQRFFGNLMGTFAAQALLLACLGVYGLLAYAVSRRTHEIGVRMVLGARPVDVVRMVVRHGASLAAAGVSLGLVLALAVGRGLQGILYGVNPWDPGSLLAIAAFLGAVVLLASLLPARRAAAVDPMTALRSE